MEPKNNNNAWENISGFITIAIGSSVQAVILAIYKLAVECGVDPEMLARNIVIDGPQQPAIDIPGLTAEMIDKAIDSESQIRTVMSSNPQTLEELERKGLFSAMPPGWYKTPGASGDALGASGDSRIGYTLLRVVENILIGKFERALQKVRDHNEQIAKSTTGAGKAQTRVVLQCMISTVGGTGNGGMYRMLSGLLQGIARKAGIETKLVLNIMTRGNLSVTDQERADLNEFTAVKYVQVRSAGTYVDPVSGILGCKPQDLLFLSANQNGSGNIPDFGQFLMHEAQTCFFLYHTPAGKRVLARLNDHETVEFDEYGAPLPGFSAGCVTISRNADRVMDFCKNAAVAEVAEYLRTEADPEAVHEQSISMARLHGLYESDEDNLIVAPLMRPEALDGEYLPERARDSFNSRIAGLKRVERAETAIDSQEAILNGDMPEVYEPAVQIQAQTRLEAAQTVFQDEIKRTLRSPDGLSRAAGLVRNLLAVLEQSGTAITGKLNELQQLQEPFEEVLAEAQDVLQRIKNARVVERLLRLPPARRVAQTIEEAGRAIIDYSIQNMVCTIAVSHFVNPLVDWLEQQLQWIEATEQKLRQISGACQTKAHEIAAQSTDSNISVGLELTDGSYLPDYYKDRVKDYGGPSRFCREIFNRMLEHCDSAMQLARLPAEEFTQSGLAVADEMIRPAVEMTDVAGEFTRLYPEKARQKTIIDQLVRHSEGRFLVTGEVQKEITWLKAVNVPSDSCAEWIKELLEAVDQKSGKWETAVNGDPDRITIFQMRNRISLSTHLQRLFDIEDAELWAKVISRAPDPVSTLIVPPNPSAGSFRRVLAKAIATGQLTVQNGSFYVNCVNGEKVVLGEDYAAVDRKLRLHWSSLVFLESVFGRDLVVDDERIKTELLKLRKALADANTAQDKRLELIDQTAVDECLLQHELLAPWARRIRQFH